MLTICVTNYVLVKMCGVAQMQAPHNGEMRAIFFDELDISSTYSTLSLDGRVLVDAWRDLFDMYKINIGDKLISMLHHGDVGSVLFLHTIPRVAQY